MTLPPDYQPAPGLLQGRAILVTGAGQGLGREVAMLCARLGATVALHGRKQEKLEQTYDAIVAAGGAEPAMIPLDLATADTAQFESMAALIGKELGGLAGIAHCASHFVPLGPLANQTLEQWNVLLRVNLAAPFALTRACLPMLQAANGSVVFTGETHGVRPAAFWGGFAVSKAGLTTLAAIWADELELKGQPRMNVLVPGAVATPQRLRSHPGEDRGRQKAPEDVARAYAWLLGPDSKGTTGETIAA
jgi:NAD(P)-dependent dehydrogenase (short-subunit alcohol dehydrogenase family)